MNADAIKEFLFRHFEKFIFGALTLLALLLIYEGVTKPDILAQYQPAKLEGDAQRVKNSIDEDHWEAIKEPRLPTVDILDRTNKSMQPVDPSTYALSVPWEAKSIDLSVKRTDPTIPVPIDIRVTGVVATLAAKWAPETPEQKYPLAALEPADKVEKVEQKKPRVDRRKARMEAMMMMGGMSSDSSMMSMDPSMMDPSMMDPSMMGSGSGMMGPGSMPAVATRKVDAKLYDQGFRPTNTKDTQPVLGHFIAGVALMPHKQLHEEFKRALAERDGYDRRRDQPYYIGFELQRADVTVKPVDQLTDADWVPRANSRYFELLVLRAWSGMAKEIVTGKYRDPALTAAIPPVMLDHYEWFAAHPKIPLGNEATAAELMAQGALKKNEAPVGPVLPGDAKNFSTSRGRVTGQSMGPGMDMMGSGGMMMSPYGGEMEVEQAEFKLIRFYDFRDFTGRDPAPPVPGRKYVYRVRIALEDPNFPADPLAQPRSSTLSSEVFKRVATLTAKAEELAKANPAVPRDQSLWTMWSQYSEPSPAVSLPPLTDAYAGPVFEPGTIRSYQVGGNNIEFYSKPPKAKVVVTRWDPSLGVPVPVFMEASNGTVVNKDKSTFDVPDPVSLEVKKVPETNINTGNVVLDVVGGKPLSISPAEDQTEPGMLLMFDPVGGLKVVDEIETQRGYRLYSAADDRGE